MKRISSTFRAFTYLLFFVNVCSAGTYSIKSVQEYVNISKTIRPGDTAIWLSGTYSDIKWVIEKDGITIFAQKPGSVVFNGYSSVTISSNNVRFSGFQFIDGSVTGNVVEVSGNYNRISGINIVNYASHYYFHITPKGRYNMVEKCNFENKPQAPAGKEGSSIFQVAVDSINPGYNCIRYCSFKSHTAPPNAGGDYGMEALRIGYSYQSRFISRTIVEYCYFTRCNGDGEIISNKARQNIFRYNTFSGNGDSHLTLRHGKENAVYGNFFINGAGIRIKEGQDQMVYNNYFCTGRYFSVRLENYRVDPLKNIVIAYNTFYKSGPLRLGGNGDFKPEGVLIAHNLFVSPTAQFFEEPTGKEQFRNNAVSSESQTIHEGFYRTKLESYLNGEYFQPKAKVTGGTVSLKLFLLDIPELEDDPEIKLDISGNKRPEKTRSDGCFEPDLKSLPVIPYASLRNTGPEYLMKRDYLINQVFENIRKETIEKADRFMKEEPVTVTASSCKRSAGGKNDFYSEGDYWWPDPANPSGPYIQKDGQTNPENFVAHRLAMIRLSEITATLTSAWILTGKQKYAGQVLKHLNAWFVNPETRMNPDMLYAQAIWGRFTGRGIGLIDAYHFVEVARSVNILEEKAGISPEQLQPVKTWFSDFLEWMTTHQYGIDEMNARNNHGTCWAVTASAIADLTGNEEVRKMCADRFKTVLLPSQMAGDGSFPLELKRTKPYGYSLFNIDAMCNLAQILSTGEDNLWEFQTPDGKSLNKGMEYIYPFIADKTKWPFAKDIYIWDEWPVRQSSLLFAGIAFQKEEYINTFLKLPANPAHPEVIRNLPVRHPVIWLVD